MKKLAGALLLFLASAGGRSVPAAPAASNATCVFTNPAFAGKCVQTAPVGPGGSAPQTCASILACLNDTACLKTFCQATTIRSGWKLESAK